MAVHTGLSWVLTWGWATWTEVGNYRQEARNHSPFGGTGHLHPGSRAQNWTGGTEEHLQVLGPAGPLCPAPDSLSSPKQILSTGWLPSLAGRAMSWAMGPFGSHGGSIDGDIWKCHIGGTSVPSALCMHSWEHKLLSGSPRPVLVRGA
jgi:hypothetical protein